MISTHMPDLFDNKSKECKCTVDDSPKLSCFAILE